MRAVLGVLAVLLIAAYGVVFVTFLLDARRLGGDALIGRESDGRWFVRDGRRETEVPEADWRRNRSLGLAVAIGFPFAFASIGYLGFGEVFPRLLLPSGRGRAADAERRVRASGPAAASARCGGSIGWFNFSGPLLRVSVHPGGIAVKPFWMPVFGIPREGVRSVERRKGILGPRVVVEHDATVVRSPVVLQCRDEALLAALEGLVPRRR